MTRLPFLLTAIIVLGANAFAQSIPAATHPTAGSTSTSLPHETHDGITVSADRYNSLLRIKKSFKSGDLWRAGVVPIELTFQNHSEHVIRIDLDTITLDVQRPGGESQHLRPLKAADVGYAIAHEGLPSSNYPDMDSSATWEAQAEAIKIDRILIKKDLIPANSSIHGFLFFKIGRDMTLLARSSIYVPDVFVEPSKTALMFFEVPLGNP
jgi:hypothetical protein